MRAQVANGIAALAALAGLFFAAYSTKDFVQHLDRQVHGLHCSFLPGIAEADTTGESGCHVTLMSPYSSVMREAVWGGIPVSVPAMAVFAFLFAWSAFLAIGRYPHDPRATGFLAAAWGLPLLTSVGMGYLSIATLNAACKLCIGIYASSAIGFAAALATFLFARQVQRAVGAARPADATQPSATVVGPRISWGMLGAAFAIGVLFVVVPVGAYATTAPDFSRFVGACGTLADPSDPHRVLLPIGPQTRSVPMLEVIDPLCPSCKGFERRFDASSVQEEASRRVLLFPLDDRCNWMIDRAIHPGACAISEAVLCAEGDAETVLEWAFENQQSIMAAARRDPAAAAQMARQRFPALASCIGSPTVQAKLNNSLRWAVQNQLPVLTPQVYVGDERLCDADTDLGMDYALRRLVARYRENPNRRVPRRPSEEAPAIAAPPARRTPAPAARPAPSTPRPVPSAPAPEPPVAPEAAPVTPVAPEPPADAPAVEPEPAPEVTE